MQSEKKPHPQNDAYVIGIRMKESEAQMNLQRSLFEKYRLKGIKRIMENVLCAELRYHSKVIEELSPVLAMLRDIQDCDE